MIFKRLMFGAAPLLALASFCAVAGETTWEATGTFETVEDVEGNLPPGIAVGADYRMVIRFDNEVTPWRTRAAFCDATGCRLPAAGETPTGYRYDIAQPGMEISIYAGASCQPCTFTSPTGGGLIVRNDYPAQLGAGQRPTDGITFTLQDPDHDLDIGLLLRTENLSLNIVSGPAVPYQAPAGLGNLEVSLIQLQDIRDFNVPPSLFIAGDARTVSNSTFGIGYLFTARDCRMPARTDTQADGTPVDPRPYDCANIGATRRQGWSVPSQFTTGGGLGLDLLSRILAPSTSDIDASWGDGLTLHADTAANLGLTPVQMGALFGEATFGGPAAFPVLRGSTHAGDSARINTNLFSYQRYSYSGGVTQLPLVLALTYHISDNSFDPVSPFQGDRPGGASLGATMSIVDGGSGVRLEAIRQAASSSIRGIACGNEAALGLPAGSILGTAEIDSQPGEQGDYAVTRPIESCANPGQPITLASNQDFIVVTGMQLPSRGRTAQPPLTNDATANGWVDSANTLRVTFDPAAPRELIQALADSIAPACADCDLAPEEKRVGIDIKPGSSDNCINPGSNGVIPVAVLGSAEVAVTDMRIDDSLKLGSLGLRVRGKAPGCSVKSVNGDAYPDLLCHFDNVAGGWRPGQNTAAVSGKFVDGVPFVGSDNICLVQ